MKNTLSVLTLLLISTATLAQQTVKRSNYLANSIMEKFEVLKADKKVRQGTFVATFKSTTVAKGNYQDGKRSGNWDFFNTKGKLVQTYNYTQNKLTFLDTADTQGLKYFLENVKATDVVSAPVKIGGSCYGLLPILYRQDLSDQVRNDNPGIQKITYTHIITLNDKGNIISHQVKANIKGISKTYTLDDSRLDPDVARFVPATLNHHAVPCQITTVTYSTFSGAIVRQF